jgi:hypothetical protein
MEPDDKMEMECGSTRLGKKAVKRPLRRTHPSGRLR